MRGRRQASVTHYVTLVGARAGRPNGLSCGTADHAQKVGPIVAWLLDEDRLGGSHFNDGRYANDDFTLGSSDPHQVFRIFHAIHGFAADRGRVPKSAAMIDRGQNEKRRIKATIQTVAMAQELYAQAAPVDHAALRRAKAENNVVDAELIVKHAFFTDVAPALAGWRKANRLPADPLTEHRRTGYARAAAAERPRRLRALGLTPGGRFARHGAGPLGLQATAR